MARGFPFDHLTQAEVAEYDMLVDMGANWCRAHGRGPRLYALLAKRRWPLYRAKSSAGDDGSEPPRAA